jgi:hypothetical protein
MNPLSRLFHRHQQRATALLATGALEGRERDRALRHVHDCAECRAEHESLRAALDAIPRDEHLWSEPPLAAGALAARVRATLDARSTAARAPRWRLAAGAASLVACAALAAMMMTSGGERAATPATNVAAPQAAVSPELLDRIERNLAREQAARYLDDAQALLVAVAVPIDGGGSGGTLDLADETARSRVLLERRALLVDLDHDAVAGARPLLDDVSDVLREVAALPAAVRRSDLQPVQDEIRRRRLIMKADLLARELQG